MSKITFKDIHIGDTVVLKTGKTGIVLKLVSVPYINNFGLNDNTDKKQKAVNFSYNEKRETFKIYNTVTVYVKGYQQIVNCDLNSIVKVIQDTSNYSCNRNSHKFIDFIKSIWYNIKLKIY